MEKLFGKEDDIGHRTVGMAVLRGPLITPQKGSKSFANNRV